MSEKFVLDNLARQGQLDNTIAAGMGRSIAEYHAALASESVNDGHARIQEVVEELIFELDKHESVFSQSQLERFHRAGRQELLSCKAMLDERAQASQFAEDSSKVDSEEAREYLELALKYLVPGEPVLVAMGGVSGSGKSTQATLVAPSLGNSPVALLLRSDAERKRAPGLEPTTELPPSHYTPDASRLNYGLLLDKAAAALAAGLSVIVDAVFLEEQQRIAIEELASETGVPFSGIWLHAPVELLQQRTANRHDDASDATEHVLKRQLNEGYGAQHWTQIPSNGSKEQVNERVLTHLAGICSV